MRATATATTAAVSSWLYYYCFFFFFVCFFLNQLKVYWLAIDGSCFGYLPRSLLVCQAHSSATASSVHLAHLLRASHGLFLSVFVFLRKEEALGSRNTKLIGQERVELRRKRTNTLWPPLLLLPTPTTPWWDASFASSTLKGICFSYCSSFLGTARCLAWRRRTPLIEQIAALFIQVDVPFPSLPCHFISTLAAAAAVAYFFRLFASYFHGDTDEGKTR